MTMTRPHRCSPLAQLVGGTAAVAALLLLLSPPPAQAQEVDPNEPGILEPVSSALQGRVIRIPNSDQSVDGETLNLVDGEIVYENAEEALSMLGHPITHVASPNDDMRFALIDLVNAADAADQEGMETAAEELEAILLGTTEGRIYDGFAMLNFNRWKEPGIGAEYFPPDAVEGEYKMKVAVDTGMTYTSPYDGEERKIWEIDVNMLYYDGQIDSDTFLVRFPFGHHQDDVLWVNYRIFSMVEEDFSPTQVMLDWREAPDTVNFPFKGLDQVWIPFDVGEVLNVTVKYSTVRQIRGVYDWGWRVHPPRIQFMQPIYEIENQWTGAIELDPQGESFAFRNREDLTIDTISNSAPEKKMYQVVQRVLDGAAPGAVHQWLTDPDSGPRGTWIEWADLAQVQTQLPPEAWDVLAMEDGLAEGDFGDYRMVSVFMNNEMYGEGPFLNEIESWMPEDVFKVKLLNLDKHTHYFRNVDFGARLHDDIGRCCGGGLTSFEVMNFKPTFGAPKVAEMQWRAGWGFRPHHDVIQQQEVFARGKDRISLKPYTDGDGEFHYGYQYTEEVRGGDFRFNPPDFIIESIEEPAEFPLREIDGADGLLIGQKTPGYGTAQMCPQDPSGDFCQTDFGPFNPHMILNWPEPPNPDVEKTELRFPAFLRNPAQGDPLAGDIIPPTAAWRPFLWISPYNGSLFIDPDNPELGHWADLTYSHGAPVFANDTMTATVEAPRGAAQVFYQFDDLFHDNSIFSPHPLSSGDFTDKVDGVDRVKAGIQNGRLIVRGNVERYDETNEFSPWVSLYDGAAGEGGCDGDVIAVAEVSEADGQFRFRLDEHDVAGGSMVCVQSIIGGFKEAFVLTR